MLTCRSPLHNLDVLLVSPIPTIGWEGVSATLFFYFEYELNVQGQSLGMSPRTFLHVLFLELQFRQFVETLGFGDASRDSASGELTQVFLKERLYSRSQFLAILPASLGH